MLSKEIVLMGFGSVGRAFFRLVEEKRGAIRSRFGLDLKWRAVFRRDSFFPFAGSQPEDGEVPGFDKRILDQMAWEARPELSSVLRGGSPGILVECSVSEGEEGEPGYGHILEAFRSGWDAVTANKGPLVFRYREMMEEKDKAGKELKFSGATAAALPVIDVACCSLAAADIERVEGILNGTSNYILTRMGEGFEYEIALKEAQERGIAEPDPARDVGGWDTAYKIVILANSLFEGEYGISDVEIAGITHLSGKSARSAQEEGKSLKLIGEIARKEGRIHMKVGTRAIDRSHPLYNVRGTEKGITFHTDSMGSVTVTGGKSDPRGAAAALLKDIINCCCH